MKNRFFTTFLLLLVGMTTAFAQDFIVLKTGSEIKSKIVTHPPFSTGYYVMYAVSSLVSLYFVFL